MRIFLDEKPDFEVVAVEYSFAVLESSIWLLAISKRLNLEYNSNKRTLNYPGNTATRNKANIAVTEVRDGIAARYKINIAGGPRKRAAMGDGISAGSTSPFKNATVHP